MTELEDLLVLMQKKDPTLFDIYQSVTHGLEWVWQCRNRDYGWGKTYKTDSSLETTFWVVKNLQTLTPKNYFVGIKEYVLNLNNPEGYWGDARGGKNTYRHTSCAINLLNIMKDDIIAPHEKELIENSKKWLMEGGDNAGGWGVAEDDHHDMHNTYVVGSTLLELGVSPGDPKMKGTMEWLSTIRLPNGTWPLHLERGDEVDVENSVKAYLLLSDLNPELKPDLERLSDFILKNQNDDGGWGAHPGLESDIAPTAYAIRCLTIAGKNYLNTPDQITKGINFIHSQQDRTGFWSQRDTKTGSVPLSSHLLKSLYEQIQQVVLNVPISAIFQLQIPTLTGRTLSSRRMKSPVREMAQVIWQLEGDEHYDIFLDSPETENILFTNSRHFVPLEVRKDIFQRTQEINEMFNILQKSGDWSRSDAAAGIYEDLNDKLVRLGKGLYFDFVPPSLQEIFSTITTRYLMIATNDPMIPWELIYIPEKDTFLGLEFALGRKVLMVADRLPLLRKSFDNVLNVLLIGNPSGNLPNSEDEVKFIAEKLSNYPQVKPRLLVGNEVTRSGLERALSEQHYDIVHFAGHSYYNAENPNKSYLELADGDAIYASQFSWLFQKGVPSLIFLNACSTARDASKCGAMEEGQLTGMIRQLMNIGVQSVIGSLWSMHDIISATIASEFYKDLMQGMTLGEALQSARKIVYNSFRQRNVGWNGFILYGNPMLKLD